MSTLWRDGDVMNKLGRKWGMLALPGDCRNKEEKRAIGWKRLAAVQKKGYCR